MFLKNDNKGLPHKAHLQLEGSNVGSLFPSPNLLVYEPRKQVGGPKNWLNAARKQAMARFEEKPTGGCFNQSWFKDVDTRGWPNPGEVPSLDAFLYVSFSFFLGSQAKREPRAKLG